LVLVGHVGAHTGAALAARASPIAAARGGGGRGGRRRAASAALAAGAAIAAAGGDGTCRHRAHADKDRRKTKSLHEIILQTKKVCAARDEGHVERRRPAALLLHFSAALGAGLCSYTINLRDGICCVLTAAPRCRLEHAKSARSRKLCVRWVRTRKFGH